jgi:iron(III) transport system substrate-binding protein
MSAFRKGRRPAVKILGAVALAACFVVAGTLACASAAERPSYYPSDYDKIVEASKKEDGLLIYSIMAEYNWRPVIEGFNKLYPWIKVSTLDLNSNEVFTRYYAERSSGARTTDLIITASVDGWLEFLDKGNAIDYVSAESDKLPAWSRPRPGFYTVSTDPMVMVYNKLVVPEDKRPKGIAHLAKLVQEHPKDFRNALTTYNGALSSFGQAIDLVFLRRHGEKGWAWFDVLGQQTRPEQSSGPMLAKLASGEYKVGYFISGIVFFPKLKDPANAKIMGWNFIEDGTVLFMRMMAIPKGAASINSAKLMLDYILSHDGQAAFGRGGLTPYREDVKKDDVAYYTYGSIKEEVGEENILLIDYNPDLIKNLDKFIERWKQAYRQK